MMPELLNTDLRCEDYIMGERGIPSISASASVDKEGKVHISIANLNPNKEVTLTCPVVGDTFKSVSGEILTAKEMAAFNTFEKSDVVEPVVFNGFKIKRRNTYSYHACQVGSCSGAEKIKIMTRSYKFLVFLAAGTLIFSACKMEKSSVDYPIQPVSFTSVRLTVNSWAPRIKKNATVTIPIAFSYCESTGRVRNFEIAGGLDTGKFVGAFPFDD